MAIMMIAATIGIYRAIVGVSIVVDTPTGGPGRVRVATQSPVDKQAKAMTASKE